jgi:hypothetical protein
MTTAGYSETLALVDGGGIGGNQRVKFPEAVGHGPPVEARHEFARLIRAALLVGSLGRMSVPGNSGNGAREKKKCFHWLRWDRGPH